MSVQWVKPDDGAREGRWVAIAIVSLLTVTAVLLPFHQKAQKISVDSQHQVSVQMLSEVTRALVADLKLAHEEIRDIYSDGSYQDDHGWPTPEALAQEWLAPFTQDKSWQHYGEHQWSLIESGFYLGKAGLEGQAPDILLNANGEVSIIWIATQTNMLPSRDDLTAHGLENLAWKQVVFTSTHN
ncbi:DUF6162 family protein [Vibrio sp. SCSIO 43136]|uniref:DUF6162 family protein n=1 Tax=Vibrio sp. SCSIO 43136 TaxID=2819101 RepID=UPI0020751B04|nr:DUF6162 family protein [Vibrio sp. SCSIO 43136]USD67109.1 hypothetical protein J4N39_20965 [Vibrio sp. SCSIO 43136]